MQSEAVQRTQRILAQSAAPNLFQKKWSMRAVREPEISGGRRAFHATGMITDVSLRLPYLASSTGSHLAESVFEKIKWLLGKCGVVGGRLGLRGRCVG